MAKELNNASSPLSPVGAKIFGADAAGNAGYIKSAPTVDISQFGASPSATAEENTAAINAALAASMFPTVSAPGCYAVMEDPSYRLRVSHGVVFDVDASQNAVSLIGAWGVAGPEFVYSDAGLRDTVNTYKGQETAKIIFNADPNAKRVTWVPSVPPQCTPRIGLVVSNPTDHSLAIDLMIDTSGTFSPFATVVLVIPPTGGSWETVWVAPDSMLNGGALFTSGTSWAKGGIFGTIKNFRLRRSERVTAGWADGDTVNVASIFSAPAKKRPVFMLNFDDAYNSIYTNRSWLSSRGLKGTVYAYPFALGKAGYMTEAQVRELYELGWDIADHTNTEFFPTPTIANPSGSATYSGGAVNITISGSVPRPGLVGAVATVSGLSPNNYNGNKVITAVSGQVVSYTHADFGVPSGTASLGFNSNSSTGMVLLSEAEQLATLIQCRRWLTSNGYTRASRHNALPIGGLNLTVLQQMDLAGGYDTVRTTTPSAIPWSGEALYFPRGDQESLVPTILNNYGVIDGFLACGAHVSTFLLGGVASIEPGETTANKIRIIDYAIATGGTLCLLTHTLNAPDSVTHLAVLDHLAAQRDAGSCDVLTISEWYEGMKNRV